MDRRLSASAAAPDRAWLGAAVVFALAVLVRAPRLGAASLWLDEAVAVHLAQRDLPGILLASQADTSPPVYYLLLALFERAFGIGEAAVRWPSVLAGAAAGAALFLLARRALGGAAAWIASGLFLLSDVNLRFSREARPYELAVLLAVLSFAAFLRLREQPSWHNAGLVAASNLLLFLTHYVTAFAAVAQLLALLPGRDPRAIRRFVAAHVPAAAIAALWSVPVVASQQARKMGWLAGPTRRIGRMIGWYADGMRWPGMFFVLLAGTLLALHAARRRAGGAARVPASIFALWGLVPIALAFAVSFAWPCLHARYLLYATPGLILFWTAGVVALPAGWPRWTGAAAALLLAGAGWGRNLRPNADWRGSSAFARAAGVERVMLVPEWEAPALAYYLDPGAFRDPPCTRARLAAAGVHLLATGEEPRALDLSGVGGLVLLQGDAQRAEGEQARRALAEAGFFPVEQRAWPGIRALRFSRGPARPEP